MINKEILEIKKLIKKDSNSTIRICGCYVAGSDKQKLTYVNDYLSNLPEEEQHKYVELLRKTLSGRLDKNLYNLEFTTEAENEGGAQHSLYALLESELKQTETLEAYYDYIISNFNFVGNYFILVMFDTYDVITKAEDEAELDESSVVFKYIISCICPVNLAKPALSYNEEQNSIAERTRDWVVDAPCIGFMFPAFNDRSADIHSLLYYVKSAKEMYGDFIENGLGCTEVVPGESQKEIFKDIIEKTLTDKSEYEPVDIIRDINENIEEMMENKADDEPVILKKDDIKELFAKSGISNEDVEMLDELYTEELGEDMELNADSIMEKSKFEVKTNNVVISVKPEYADIVKIKMVDGMKCLVIPMDRDVEINGIMSAVKEKLEDNTKQ